MNKIIIYTNETCPYCKQIKEALTDKKIEFENRITSDHPKDWYELTFLTGMPTVPTLFYEEEYLVPGRDFRSADHLLEILNGYKKTNFSEERRIIEQLKTLTYNIQTAFGRTSQILTQIETKIK
jgi:glutaredoxin|tara:strand:- start:740 stop:1111 length:372 start_codon:yes stop_codon:yes gene_type:complete